MHETGDAHQTAVPGEDRREILRRLLLRAGLEVLERDGLGLRPDAITYAKVFAHLEETSGRRVSRASVHGRIWSSQEDFQHEVLVAAAVRTSPYHHVEELQEGVNLVLDAIDQLGLQGRERVRAFCRIAGRALIQIYIDSEEFRRFQVLKAAARSEATEVTAGLRGAIHTRSDGDRNERLLRFASAFEALGLRPRSSLGLSFDDALDVVLRLVQVLVTGTHLDHHAGFPAASADAATTLMVEDEDWGWTNFGLGLLAFVELLFELDPAADPADQRLAAPTNHPIREHPTTNEGDGGRAFAPGRRRRSELRRAVVAAGVELLFRDGLSLKADSLSYASVFAHVEATRGITVHRSMVHGRIWPSQAAFRADVLAEAANSGTAESLLTVREAMAAQPIARNADGSLHVRQLILDNTRSTVLAQLNQSTTSPTFNRWQSIKASVLAPERQPDADLEVVRKAVARRYGETLSTFVSTYRSIFPLIGLTVNPELAMSEDDAYNTLALLGTTISVGAEFNLAAGAEAANGEVMLPRADDPTRRDAWPVAAVGALAVLDLLFVPVGPSPR